MTKKTYKDTPRNYAVCEHVDCPLAATCLHAIAYRELLKTEDVVQLINPSRCTASASCPLYRSNEPVRYARGFRNFQRKMFPGQYHEFMQLCMARFSRNPYFERRRGDYPLPPSEQEFILKALRDSGVEEEMQFDAYELMTNWYD